MIMSSWDSAATTASKEVEPDTQETGDAGVEPDTQCQETVDAGDNFPICQPEGARVLGGFGPPRICDLPGRLAISMMEEGFALQADGPPLGGILRMVRTGTGCEKGYWRRPPREPEA